MDGVVTKFLNINRGVPQGTVLCPILFSIMVNDIKPVSSSSLLIKQADDITVSVPIKSSRGQIDPSHQEVCSIKLWADYKMTLNFKKTFEMVVRGKTRKTPPGDIVGIVRKELKLLGVTFNEDRADFVQRLSDDISISTFIHHQ